jgi:thiosulfate/3-mercaptopyruvate sulfurtransferase
VCGLFSSGVLTSEVTIALFQALIMTPGPLSLLIAGLVCFGPVLPAAVGSTRSPADHGVPLESHESGRPSEPWTTRQTIQPAELAKEISHHDSRRPTIICVGFRTLYEGAHVPGAVFRGPAMSAEGLADLKHWAQGLPRSTNLVIYCGCCPLAHCPNVRPAFTALRAMGFTRLKVLLLPHDFARDWVAAGYPVSKGK